MKNDYTEMVEAVLECYITMHTDVVNGETSRVQQMTLVDSKIGEKAYKQKVINRNRLWL